jgi:tRNA splicing endonuclease
VEVEAEVTEEDSRAIPGWLAGLAGIVTVALGLKGAQVAAEVIPTASVEDKSIAEVYRERAEDRKLLKLRQEAKEDKSLFGFGYIQNPWAGSSDADRQVADILAARERRVAAWRKKRDQKFAAKVNGPSLGDLASLQAQSAVDAALRAKRGY